MKHEGTITQLSDRGFADMTVDVGPVDREGLVTKVTSLDDAERSKPFPDIFQAALQRLSLPADQAVVVGDSPHDAVAARAAGIVTIGVLCGGFLEADLREAGCAEIYQDPQDLLQNYDRSILGRRP